MWIGYWRILRAPSNSPEGGELERATPPLRGGWEGPLLLQSFLFIEDRKQPEG
jgi:hypothetical protein